ncbi:MAG: hypothetical protein R3B72_39355 [Polyangiaceae bacterium]
MRAMALVMASLIGACGSQVQLGSGAGGAGGAGVGGGGPTSSVTTGGTTGEGGSHDVGGAGGGIDPGCEVVLHETFEGPAAQGWPAPWAIAGVGLVDGAGGLLLGSPGITSEAWVELPPPADLLEVRMRFRFDPTTDQGLLLGLRGAPGDTQAGPLAITLERWFGDDLTAYLAGTITTVDAASQWLGASFLPPVPPHGEDQALWLRATLGPDPNGATTHRLGLRVWPLGTPEPSDEEVVPIDLAGTGTGFSVGVLSYPPKAAPLRFEEIIVCLP